MQKFGLIKNEFHKYKTLIFVAFVFFMGASFAFIATRNSDKSSAISTDGFNPGNIISDAVMADYQSMTVEEIQQFLTEKNPCNNRNYNLYKEQSATYPKISWHWEGDESSGHFVCLSEEKFGEGVEIGEGQTAAEIIYAAAQEYKINPQVLLVLLEKEQGLISDTYPHSNQYRSATGYGCPDTAACDTKYYGFKNQVFNAAELFRYTLDNGSVLYPDNKAGVYVAYNPSSNCGGTEVFIENRATSALYRYTPYQPNAAALAAGFGMGNVCSAYGNRNFYLYFTQWFGSTKIKVDGDPASITDGTYILISATSSDVAASTSSNNAQSSELTKETNQQWIIKHDTTNDKYYTITNKATGRPLSIDGTITNGVNVKVADDGTTCAKKWKIYQTVDGYLTFESACSAGYVIDLNSSNNNLALWSTHGGKNQKWQLLVGPVLADGIYQISSKLNREQVLDINGSNNANGAKITLWQQNQTHNNQSWQLQYHDEEDYYTIINPYTGKSLSSNNTNVHNGAKIELWEPKSTCAQKWKIVAKDDGAYSIHSLCSESQVLDLNGAATNGVNISLWQSHGGTNQQWFIDPIDPVLTDGIYNITSRTSASASFDIINGVDQDGANVAIWQLHGGTNQQWQSTYNPIDGTYTLYNQRTNRYLGAASQNAKDGVNIQIQTDNDTCATKWHLYPNLDGYYTITSACQPYFVVDLNKGPTNGNNITLWQAHGGIHQQWQFVKP